ncbi:MAG: P-loop NTPase [Bryobacterales bacterium]|nr:P-loop NTPase [Bryobacterales bacterium]
MSIRKQSREAELNAILICPNRPLADQFLASVPRVRGFQILADLKNYPTVQTADIRLRQLQPEVVLIDLSSNFSEAGELIRHLSGVRPAIRVVGLHTANDSEVILGSVRLGASEFLYSPFDEDIQREAVARLRRLREPSEESEPDTGKVVLFSSSKPGSGSSTLATQTAFALKRATGRRVLLIDMDLTGGTIGFFLKLSQRYSLVDAVEGGQIDSNRWSSLTITCGGVDILTAPENPYLAQLDSARIQEVLQYTRFQYDWVVLDTPPIFHRLSLLALSEADRAFLISTSELPSLHLTRKAVVLLGNLGFTKDRFQVVVNRMSKKEGLQGTDLSKLFDCPVQASLPNDYFSLHRVITLGRPLANDCELGRAIDALAGRIAGVTATDKKSPGGVMSTKPAFSES